MAGNGQPGLMRIYFCATMYPNDASDFRGVFIRQMVYALANLRGVELVTWVPPGALPDQAIDATTTAESAWLRELLRRGGISHMVRSGGFGALKVPATLLRMLAAGYRRHPDVDIYHLNWLQTALPLPDNGKPALITVLGNDLRLLRLPFMRSLLRRVMRRRKVAICPNADWMEPILREAFGDVAMVEAVSFGIEPRWYGIERDHSPETRRWLVVARITSEKLGPLFDWSRPLFEGTGRELHLFGPMEQQIEIPAWVHYHGPASPQDLAEEWFPAAQGLITLSEHAEGRPQVMLEAMAAGLPIIASRMPAHTTVVSDGETGMLCDSPGSYAEALQALEDPGTNAQYGEAARRVASANVGTWDDCARRYHRIHRRLLEEFTVV